MHLFTNLARRQAVDHACFITQILDLDFVNTPTTLHTTYETTALCAWLHLEPYSVQLPSNTAVRIEDIGIIQMKVLSLPVKMGHFSSHQDLTKEY